MRKEKRSLQSIVFSLQQKTKDKKQESFRNQSTAKDLKFSKTILKYKSAVEFLINLRFYVFCIYL
jgi:hypothetical protein